MSKLFVLSAPSGGGKTTLCQKLLDEFKELVLSISSTTRAPRGSEQHGKDYFFLSKIEFQKGIREGRFAEWAQVHGNYYGTSKEVIESAIAQGKSVLLDIDTQGAASISATYPDTTVKLFIAPPDLTTLENRLRARGTESEESIQRRLKNASQELAQAHQFQYQIVNDDLNRAYSELRTLVSEILNKERTQ